MNRAIYTQIHRTFHYVYIMMISEYLQKIYSGP